MKGCKKIIVTWARTGWKDFLAVAVLAAAVTMFLFWSFDLGRADLSVPITYEGGDEYSLINTARLVKECGWNTGTDRIAATQDYYYNNNEIISGLHNADVALVKLFLAVGGGDIAKAANLTYLSAFYLIALNAYIVLQRLRAGRLFGALGALVYAFLPFIFMRGMAHIGLSSYYFVPFGILMAVWIYEDERFMMPGKGFFRYQRNYAGMVMAFLIASEGIGYWQVFSCFFIMTAAAVGIIRTKNWRSAVRGITAIASVAAAVLLHCIPSLVSIAASAGQGSVSRPRSAIEAELYGFKITQLFLPVNAHKIPILQEAISGYNQYMPLVNENRTAYLGLAGIVGFLILMLWLFADKKSETPFAKRLSVLSDMNLCAVLLATIGGVGGMIYLLGFDMLRCYNRISVFIAFICIAALCIVLERIRGQIKKGARKAVFAAAVTVFMLFSMWEQRPELVMHYEKNKEKWIGEQEFIAEIESIMEEDDKIFMLPYLSYPENTTESSLAPLSHLSAYFHSERLRWSFGTIAGSEADDWCQSTAKLSAVDMVEHISQRGFSGIYIDRKGFSAEEWQALENGLQECLNRKPVVSGDGEKSFYKIR